MESLNSALGYYITVRLIGVHRNHYENLLGLEEELTSFLFAHERTFVERAQACNQDLLEQFWDTVLAISHLPNKQKAEVEERGNGVVQAVDRQWIEVGVFSKVRALQQIKEDLLDEKGARFYRIDCLAQLS